MPPGGTARGGVLGRAGIINEMENAPAGQTETGTAAGLGSVDAVIRALESERYVADRGLATAIFLAQRLPKPLLLEGEAGVGKTEVAKTLAAIAGAPLDPPAVLRGAGRLPRRLRVGLQPADAAHPAAGGPRGSARPTARARIFGPQFLIKRPLLQAIEHGGGRSRRCC